VHLHPEQIERSYSQIVVLVHMDSGPALLAFLFLVCVCALGRLRDTANITKLELLPLPSLLIVYTETKKGIE
jgi:hypothetical protein